MAGLGVRIFTDEDVDGRLAAQLGRHGYDAASCAEARRSNQGIPDEDELEYAVGQQRAIVVYNIGDYVALDAAWKGAHREHCGIIAARSGTLIGALVRWMRCQFDTYAPAVQHNTLLWLAPC